MSKELKEKRPLWKHPWGYGEGLTLSVALFLIGIGIEFITNGKGLPTLLWPTNLAVGLVFVVMLVGLNIGFRNSGIVKWLSSIPAAVSSMCLFLVLVFVLGFTLQNDAEVSNITRRMGFSHMTNSYTFALAQIFFLTTLGLVTLRRLTPLSKKNMGFFINHAGLWLTLTAGILGSGDMLRINMKLIEGQEPKDLAYDNNLRLYQMSYSLKLLEFNVDMYNPKLGFIDNQSGEFLSEDGHNLMQIDEGAEAKIWDWTIKIDKFIADASTIDSISYQADTTDGAAPAAYIIATSPNGNEKVEGWVSCGSYKVPYSVLSLSTKYSAVMTYPEAQKYSSIIEATTKSGIDTFLLEVNKPFFLNGSKIYQSGYDSSRGKWSQYSVLEIVIDPWLPVVYFGFFMLLAGGIYIFWIGKDTVTEEENEKK